MDRKGNLTPDQIREISELAALAPRKLLTPKAVLSRAKNKSSALHGLFTWDNGKAAEQWRLQEARELIVRVKVVIPIGEKRTEVRAYVSLGSDRVSGGGYRTLQAVLSDKALRREMLRTALAELKALKDRYAKLEELVEVWKAVDKIKIK